MKILHHYNNDHLPNSAEIIVPYIMELLSPKSVVDVGCGVGQWLSIFKKYEVNKVVGIDGGACPQRNATFERW